MKKADRISLVEKLKTDLDGKNFVIMDYKGLNVEKFSQLRRLVKKSGYRVRVIKNTLVKKTLAAIGVAGFDDFLVEQNALIYGSGDYVELLKTMKKFGLEANLTKTKAAQIDGKPFGDNELIKISKLPTRQVLLGSIAGALFAPVSGLVFTLAYPLRALVTTLENVRQSREKTGAAK